jgi:hypothetical protein
MSTTDHEYEHLRQLVGWTVSHPVKIHDEDNAGDPFYALVLTHPDNKKQQLFARHPVRPRGQRPRPPAHREGEVRHMTQPTEDLTFAIIALRQQVATLTAERDEVRRSYCSLMEAYRGGDGVVTAHELGWGYLFEEDGK